MVPLWESGAQTQVVRATQLEQEPLAFGRTVSLISVLFVIS